MWFPEDLKALQENPANGFQIAVWHELFDPFTPDSFQPRLLNSATLVDELRSAAERAHSVSVWRKHVHLIKEELALVANQEEDLLTLIPEFKWRLNSLFKMDHLGKLVLTCNLIREQRREYDALIFQNLLNSVESLPQKKDAALKSLRRLATLAIHSGKAFEEFGDIVHTDNLTMSRRDLATKLVTETTEQEQEYLCVLSISGDRSSVQRVSRKAGFDLLKKCEIELLALGEVPSTFVIGRVCAISARVAARDCAKRIRRALDVFNLYSNSAALNLLDDVHVKCGGQQDYRRFNLGDQALRKLHPRNRCGELTVAALDCFSNGDGDERVFNALELHSLAHGSAAARVKLVNLWSAAECLAGLEEADSVIERICRVFAPIIMWRHVEKVVRYISFNLQTLRDAGVKVSLGPGFPKSNEGNTVEAWETMVTLCKPKDHPDIVQLLAFAANHPLLGFRVYSMWKDLTDPKQLRKTLLNSKQLIEWQFSRIYRARNLVVHDGIEVPNLPSLLDNLHYYFSITISRILHAMTIHHGWGLAESVAHWQAKVNYTLEMLEYAPQHLRIVDFFPGDRRADSSPIWT